MDSGTTDHMSNNRSWFDTYKEFRETLPIRIGDGKQIFAEGSGDINIFAFNGVEWKRKHLSNVLYVPELTYNLFSLGFSRQRYDTSIKPQNVQNHEKGEYRCSGKKTK